MILAFESVGGAVKDRIDLATIDANPALPGDQPFTFRGSDAFTGAGQVHVVAAGNDTLIQANIGGSVAPELEVLVQDGDASPSQWSASDFIL
ncbi:MAG: hypothetical protein ACXW3P_01525 [Rhodospirillales bacterium]